MCHIDYNSILKMNQKANESQNKVNGLLLRVYYSIHVRTIYIRSTDKNYNLYLYYFYMIYKSYITNTNYNLACEQLIKI